MKVSSSSSTPRRPGLVAACRQRVCTGWFRDSCHHGLNISKSSLKQILYPTILDHPDRLIPTQLVSNRFENFLDVSGSLTACAAPYGLPPT